MKIAVISGKGGTGKSSVTAALVTLAQEVQVIDCDVDAANLYLIFQPQIQEKEPFISAQQAVVNPERCISCGHCITHCHFKAIDWKNDVAFVNEVACEGCQLCAHLCPVNAIQMKDAAPSFIYKGKFRFGQMVYGRLAPGEENSGKLISYLRQYADQVLEAPKHPLVILDGPPGIGCPVISTITGVDKIILVTEPSLSGMSDLKRVHELARNFSSSLAVILNKYDLDLKITQEIEEWCTLQQTPVIAHLPFDKAIVEAQLEAQSIIEYAPNSACSLELQQAFQRLQNL